MARERMVTRTIEVTVVEIMCVDIHTANVHTDTFTLTGKSDKNTLTRAKKEYETDETKLVAIQSETKKEMLAVMKEEEFIKMATILPPRIVQETEE